MNNAYCPNCFRRGCYNGVQCGACGWQNQKTGSRPSLAPGICLNQRYFIGRVLGVGGFGITYLALDARSRQRCAVKEYFPSEFSVRGRDDISVTASTLSKEEAYQHGIEKFMDEAKNLHNMSDIDSIVNIWDCFEENGTAYFIMNFLDGSTLKQEFSSSGNKIDYERATDILLSVMRTLALVHKRGLIHRDISPENIFLTRNGMVVLLDFGAARGYLEKEKNARGGFSILLKHGFAPIEQYYTSGNQGTWTDVYALAATYYYMVSGERVPPAVERVSRESALTELHSICPQVPPKVSRVISKALEVDYKKRIPDMEQFYNEMCRAAGTVGADASGSIRTDTKAYVTRIDVSGKKQRWRLPPNQPMLMGRTVSDKCDIVIDRIDRMVSRKHCYVTYLADDNVFQLCDMSEYGTFVQQGRLIKNRNMILPAGTVFYAVSQKYQFLLEVE